MNQRNRQIQHIHLTIQLAEGQVGRQKCLFIMKRLLAHQTSSYAVIDNCLSGARWLDVLAHFLRLCLCQNATIYSNECSSFWCNMIWLPIWPVNQEQEVTCPFTIVGWPLAIVPQPFKQWNRTFRKMWRLFDEHVLCEPKPNCNCQNETHCFAVETFMNHDHHGSWNRVL